MAFLGASRSKSQQCGMTTLLADEVPRQVRNRVPFLNRMSGVMLQVLAKLFSRFGSLIPREGPFPLSTRICVPAGQLQVPSKPNAPKHAARSPPIRQT